MIIASTYADNAAVLRVGGRLDAITAAEFENTYRQSVNAETRKVVLDFQGLEYISSAGLRAVLLVGKMVQAGGGTLVLACLSGTVKTVLEMSGFCALFPVYDSVEVALESS